ncbi:hypothetical protein ACUSIJ_16285 [Pseudochelatococcus sp. B33]
MDPDSMVIGALGVLLTEVRVARRALEEVERASSRYMGIEFSKAFAEGASFGAPPMYQGALRVHVININDLAPGNSIADLLMGLLGGVGHLVGGIIGGAIGGTVAAWGLPMMIRDLRRTVGDIREIIRMLGITAPQNQPSAEEANPVTQAETGETLLTTVDGIQGLVRGLTALFTTASEGPGAGDRAGRIAPEVLTPEGQKWMEILSGVNRLLERAMHLVDGLILLIPSLVGAIALLVTSLPEIRRELLLTFQFILRNILVLRGVVLTTIFEIMATAARLTASIVGIIGTVLEGILGSIVSVISSILDNAFAALEVMTGALTAIVKALLQWLVNGVFNTLREIGNLSVFRTIDHLVRMLPGLIEPIFMITVAVMSDSAQRLPEDLTQRLNTAFDAGFAGMSAGVRGTLPGAVAGTGAAPTTEQIIGDFPKIDDILDPLHDALSAGIATTGAEITTATRDAFDTVNGALTGLGGRFDAAIAHEGDLSRRVLEGHRATITANADALASAIAAPLAAESPATGLEDIASAYQTWLTSEGTIAAIFDRAVQHLTRRPEAGEPPPGALDLMRGAYDRPHASVEIERVEIVLDPPETPYLTPIPLAPEPPMSDEDIWTAWHRHAIELDERGIRVDDPRALIS